MYNDIIEVFIILKKCTIMYANLHEYALANSTMTAANWLTACSIVNLDVVCMPL